MTSAVDSVLAHFDEDELVDIALELGAIDSPSGDEYAVSDWLFKYCNSMGYAPRRVRAVDSVAANIVAVLGGDSGHPALLFNSHMDTAWRKDDPTYFQTPHPPEVHSAWKDREHLVGVGIVNDKGPMACWLAAASAVRRSGVELQHDVVLTMVTGEIGHEPVDEFQGPDYVGKDYGSRYLATRGILADAVIVAETTQFVPIWVEPGKAFFRIEILGARRGPYTPYLDRPYERTEHPNAIVRASGFVDRIEAWALEYEQREAVDLDAGFVVPKVNIGAIRAGHATQPVMSPTSCFIYLDVRLPPGASPLPVADELRSLLREERLTGSIELYLFRRGYEAVGAARVVDALRDASAAESKPEGNVGHELAIRRASSMWRDINVWNELGIPAVTFGPGSAGGDRIAIRDLLACGRIFARCILDLAGRTADRVRGP